MKNGEVTIIPPRRRRAKPQGDPTEQDPIEVWVAWVGEAWCKSVENIITTGQRLAKLRDQTKHGDWAEKVEAGLCLSRATVNMLIKIGEHRVISNVKHIKHLPASWGTLYEMTLLDEKVLEEKLSKGEINSDTERKDVVTIRKGVVARKKKKSANPWHKLEEAIDAFSDTLLDQAKDRGVTDLELADVEVNKDAFIKRFDGLLVTLREFKKKQKG